MFKVICVDHVGIACKDLGVSKNSTPKFSVWNALVKNRFPNRA